MAGDESVQESRRDPAPSVTLRAEPAEFSKSATTGDAKENFWQDYRQHVKNVLPNRSPDIENLAAYILEERIRGSFPSKLREKFREALRKRSSLNAKQESALQAVEFRVERIAYGSIEVKTIIENLDQVIVAFGLTADIVTTLLAANAPDALNAALGYPGIAWNIDVLAANIPASANGNSNLEKGIGKYLTDPTVVWRVLNALWILPIVVSLVVLILAYREMVRITELRDTVQSGVIANETARANALYERFERKHELLLESQSNILRGSADAIRTILEDQIKRTAARSDYFDQQHVALLQRYENLSNESRDVIKTLIQKPNSCCDCDCTKPRDRCQKSANSK